MEGRTACWPGRPGGVGTDTEDQSAVGLTGTHTSSARRQLQGLTFPTSKQERMDGSFRKLTSISKGADNKYLLLTAIQPVSVLSSATKHRSGLRP